LSDPSTQLYSRTAVQPIPRIPRGRACGGGLQLARLAACASPAALRRPPAAAASAAVRWMAIAVRPVWAMEAQEAAGAPLLPELVCREL
jgi:hypothetical protein